MKTLYIISKGMEKPSDEEILKLEQRDLHPRVSLLEEAISADVLDERYLFRKVPAYRRWFYRMIPVRAAQIFEALVIHRNYDAILVHSEQVALPLALLIKYLRIKTPYVITISRITSMYKIKTRQKKWLLKHTHNRIDRILMWSSVQRKIVTGELGVPKDKVKLLKLGKDQKFWRPIPAKTDMICSVGMEMRDYTTLVEALKPTNIRCHFAAGDARGELFETVRRLYNLENIPENITIGRKSKPKLRELYARCRFIVISLLPTDSDNGQTAILEAMCMGKTVICSRVEGQVDVIQDGVTGIYVPQGDPVAMREAILDLWNDPERAEQMGKAARRYIEEHQTLEQFVQAIKREVYDVADLAGRSKGSSSVETSSVVERAEG